MANDEPDPSDELLGPVYSELTGDGLVNELVRQLHDHGDLDAPLIQELRIRLR